jgi:hypothetical protein
METAAQATAADKSQHTNGSIEVTKVSTPMAHMK